MLGSVEDYEDKKGINLRCASQIKHGKIANQAMVYP